MNIKGKIVVLYYCLKRTVSDINQLTKGQKSNYELLQLSHRIEKGLLISKPKPLWGWEKAYRINKLLQINNDKFSSRTAKAVLSAYLNSKEHSSFLEDREKWSEFIKKTTFTPIESPKNGGIIEVEKTCFSTEEINAIEKLFYTRHSCREFSEEPVPAEVINHAIQMALRCPSACNRQPFKVYVVEPFVLEKELGKKLQYKANKILFITGDVRAFTSGELLDWLISPTIFASYLTLSLHSLGIGSCVVRKDLVKNSEYNCVVANMIEITESERIVLEINIGYYKSAFLCPKSNRLEVSDVARFL